MSNTTKTANNTTGNNLPTLGNLAVRHNISTATARQIVALFRIPIVGRVPLAAGKKGHGEALYHWQSFDRCAKIVEDEAGPMLTLEPMPAGEVGSGGVG